MKLKWNLFPSDPFLTVGDDHEDINNDESNEYQNYEYTEDPTVNLQIEVQVHHSAW